VGVGAGEVGATIDLGGADLGPGQAADAVVGEALAADGGDVAGAVTPVEHQDVVSPTTVALHLRDRKRMNRDRAIDSCWHWAQPIPTCVIESSQGEADKHTCANFLRESVRHWVGYFKNKVVAGVELFHGIGSQSNAARRICFWQDYSARLELVYKLL